MAAPPAPPSVDVLIDATHSDRPLTFAANSAIVSSLPFLAWEPVPPPVAPPAGIVPPLPARRRLPQWAAIEAFSGGLHITMGLIPAPWFTTSIFQFALTAAAWTNYLSSLVDADLLVCPISNMAELWNALGAAVSRIPTPPAGLPSPNHIVFGQLDAGAFQPFDLPGIPGRPAVGARRAGGGRAAVPAVPAVPPGPPVCQDLPHFAFLTGVLSTHWLATRRHRCRCSLWRCWPAF